jgi:hypothetical protein
MAQAKRGLRSEATRLADLVRERVDEGATTVEEIHKAIADLPLDVLERLDVFKETVKDVRRIQDTSIGAVYDVIRKVNRRVAELAADILERPPKRQAARKPTRKPTRARSTRAEARA